LDWTTVTTDKLAVMAAIVKKSPVFRFQKSGNPKYLVTLHGYGTEMTDSSPALRLRI